MASENIHQVFIANPITSNAPTDLMYFGQSPYGIGNDAAMTYANFSAQFISTLSFTAVGSTPNADGASTSGSSITLQPASATLPGLVSATTQTFGGAKTFQLGITANGGPINLATDTGADAVNIGTASTAGRAVNIGNTSGTTTLTLSAGSGGISTPSLTASAVVVTSSLDVLTNISLTNGQLLIGASGALPTATTLTAGANIGITNASGSITIAATGLASFVWNNVATSSQALANNNGYITNNGASLVTYTLPATAAQGTIIEIAGFSAGGWLIAQNASQEIFFGNQHTTIGVGGSLASTNQYDQIKLLCVIANTNWVVRESIGSITVV
jgi:hypothetical protein